MLNMRAGERIKCSYIAAARKHLSQSQRCGNHCAPRSSGTGSQVKDCLLVPEAAFEEGLYQEGLPFFQMLEIFEIRRTVLSYLGVLNGYEGLPVNRYPYRFHKSCFKCPVSAFWDILYQYSLMYCKKDISNG